MGTLGQKLDYLTDTKSILKQKINNLGGSLTDESTFRSYGNYLDELYNEMPKVTGKGTEITLTPTRKGRMQLDLKGNTSQDSTSGKNLADLSILNQGPSINSGELVNVPGGVCTPLIEIDNTKDIVFSYSQTEAKQKYIMYYDENQSFLGYSLGMQTNWLLSTNTNYSSSKYVRIRFDNKATTNWCQLEYNSTATDYEPYTGGQPSPSPDFPQPIHVVTGNNTIEVQGKNLFDVNQDMSRMQYNQGVEEINANRVTTDYIPIKAGSTYTIFCDLANQNNVALINYALFDANKIYLGNRTTNGDTSFTGDKTHTFTITLTNAKYIRITFRNYADATSPLLVEDVKNSDIQLEQGSTATSYEPYTEALYPINLGSMELCKIGDYQDYLYKENGNWYKHKMMDKYIFDSTETVYLLERTGVNVLQVREVIKNVVNKTRSMINIISSHFKGSKDSDGNVPETIRIDANGQVDFTITNTNPISASTEAFKTWLNTHNVTSYYLLATPTTAQITDETLISQLDAIENAMSTTDTTTISQTNSDLPFIISASALKPFTTETLLTSLTSNE